ncbi:hypothetical protein D3C76_1783700 [compost metagenome]
MPALIEGDYKLFRRTTVTYGKPVDLSEFDGGSSEQQEAATEKIMEAIRSLSRTKKNAVTN